MYCSKSHEGTPCGWNPDHSTNYHNAAKTTPNWNIKMLAKMSPNHPLVLAVKNSGRPPPGGNTGNSGNNNDTPPDNSDSVGAAFNSLQHSKTVLQQLERSAKSDEAQAIIESMREALGNKLGVAVLAVMCPVSQIQCGYGAFSVMVSACC